MKPLRLLWILCGLLLLALTDGALAQGSRELRLGDIDVSDFPTVHLDLTVTDEALSPVTDLRGLTVREAGRVISDVGVSSVPAGVGLIFVLDANQGLDIVDAGADLSRLEQAGQGIVRYAESFMSDAGNDRVDIIVPDDAGGAFLLAEASDPQAVVAAIEAYQPELLPALTPLDDMLDLALATAEARQADGRFQAILLLTNGSELDRQLDFAALTDRAEAIRLPIFAAILGSRADPDEVANVTLLNEPTRGFYVHMPVPLDADPIFTAVQAHATRPQVSYQSLVRRSGTVTVTVTLGPEVVTGSYRLALQPPQVTLDLPDLDVARVAPEPEAALFQLEPISLTVAANIVWPDGIERAVTVAELLVDGVIVASVDLPPLRNGRVELTWPLRQVAAGNYDLVVQLVDAFGLAGRSAAETVAVQTTWPEPTLALATATPATEPTPLAPAVVAEVVWQEIPGWLRIALMVGAGLVPLVLLALLVRGWGRRRARRRLDRETLEAATLLAPAPEPEPLPEGQALLEILANGAPQQTNLLVLDENVTLGRDPAVADVIFSDPSVSRLHARLRLSDGRYWLYDEGSAAGTYLNFTRVGLMPQPVSSGDEIHLGQVRLRFHWDPGYHSAT